MWPGMSLSEPSGRPPHALKPDVHCLSTLPPLPLFRIHAADVLRNLYVILTQGGVLQAVMPADHSVSPILSRGGGQKTRISGKISAGAMTDSRWHPG